MPINVAVDETGDANLKVDAPRFAVGALYLDDLTDADAVLERARRALGETYCIFHYSKDSPKRRDAVAVVLDESELPFHFRVIAYRGSMSAEHRSRRQVETHAQLLGHALNLIPFLQTTDISVSERQASVRPDNISHVLDSIERASSYAVVSFDDLRRNPQPLTERLRIVPGTNTSALQICDHLLGRWQAAIHSGRAFNPPRDARVITAQPTSLSYFTVTNVFRGKTSALKLAHSFSQERPSGTIAAPLVAAYDGLLSAESDGWTDADHRLIFLLLNQEEAKLIESDAEISELCYHVLEGRTRWPERTLILPDQFDLYRNLALSFLSGARGHLDVTTYDALRDQICEFREKLNQGAMILMTRQSAGS